MKPQPSTAVRICENCAHAQVAPLDPNNFGAPRPLVCRRYPPTLSTLHLGGGQVATSTGSPTVPPGGTCGEWSPGVLIETN